MTAHPIRIILLEDEPLFRELLTSTLCRRAELEIVGAFQDGQEALARAPELNPDVAILDIELGQNETGVHIGLRLRQMLPDLGIVLLSNYDEPEILTAIPLSQVHGWCYLLKKSVASLDTLVRAIEGSASGLMVIDPHLIRAFKPRQSGQLSRLTPRQQEVLALLAAGYSNHVIAEKLMITEKSVENQVSLVYQNLGLQSGDTKIHPRVTATLLYLNESQHHG